jgi:hypothetical protein
MRSFAIAIAIAVTSLAIAPLAGCGASSGGHMPDGAAGAASGGAGTGSAAGSSGTGAGNGGSGASGSGGVSGTSGGSVGAAGGAAGGAGPDLSRCPIRSCLERLAAARADCTGFDVACIHEEYGSQSNYCMANGVRVYRDKGAVTELATIVKPDGHTCYSIYITRGTSQITAAVRDAQGTTIFIEGDSVDGKTVMFNCDNSTWTDDGTSCGAIYVFPFITCQDSAAGACQRP